MKSKSYEIGGRVFTQKPLVLGQLIEIVETLDLGRLQVLSTVDMLKELLVSSPGLLAIVLRDEDALQADAQVLEECLDMKTLAEVVEDFLSFNRALSSLSRLAAAPNPSAKDGNSRPATGG
jgi:hypothetical protein